MSAITNFEFWMKPAHRGSKRGVRIGLGGVVQKLAEQAGVGEKYAAAALQYFARPASATARRRRDADLRPSREVDPHDDQYEGWEVETFCSATPGTSRERRFKARPPILAVQVKDETRRQVTRRGGARFRPPNLVQCGRVGTTPAKTRQDDRCRLQPVRTLRKAMK